jgi:Tfp pilus assembly protein PilV
MMKHRALLAAIPLLALAACQQQTINGNDDPQAEALNNAAPVEAPPMIQASRTYRCKDNSLLYADFYTNNTVQVHAKKDDSGTTLTAAAAGQPYTAEGYSLSANAAQISYTAPGKGTQSCKA